MSQHRTRHGLLRTRWAAIGAAIAVTLGAGGIGITHATTTSGERPIYLPIEPCRLADTRPAFNVGPRATPLGAAETYDIAGWGTVGNCTLPSDTAGLALNVTAIDPSAPTFLTLFPDGTTLPLASHLNPTPGQPPTPNAVNVDLSAAGNFSIYNLAGNVHVAIDVVGIYDDHNHDDRYYTESEVDAALGGKANSADVYTQTEVNNRTSRIASSTVGGFPRLSNGDTLTTVSITLPTRQYVHLSAEASIFTNDTQAATCTSATFCNLGIEIYDADTNTRLTPLNGSFFRLRDTNDGQSLAISVVVTADAGVHNYRLQTNFASVIADVPFLNHATLTAMSVPFGGTGSAPAVTLDAQSAPSGPNTASG